MSEMRPSVSAEPEAVTDEMRCAGFESPAWDALARAVIRKGGWPYSCRESADCCEAIYLAMRAARDDRDAERYRWLRDALDNEEVTGKLHEAFQQGSVALDAAIDEAIHTATRPVGKGPFADWHEAAGWISAEKQLPPAYATCLVWGPGRPVITAFHFGGGWANDVTALFDARAFSHWMPLPPPPHATASSRST